VLQTTLAAFAAHPAFDPASMIDPAAFCHNGGSALDASSLV